MSICPDTNSADLVEIVRWLDRIKIGSGDVINDRCVGRCSERGFFVEGLGKPQDRWGAARALKEAAR